jgi:hypothetical protein
MKTGIAALAFLFTAGCAGISSIDCTADAYALGERDGRLGATPQVEFYAQRCAVAPDRAKYDAGWQAGRAQRPVPPV